MTAPLLSTTDRPYQLLPPLSAEQRHLLRQSIEENGVLEPVVFDEDGEILDGHHRVEIAEELGIEYPRRVIDDLDRPGKHMYALTVNVARRQLDQNARSSLVAQMRIRGMSIREIAKVTGLSKTTIARDVEQLSHSGQLDQPERITGADGKSRPAIRPTPTPAPEPVAVSPSPAADSGPDPDLVTDDPRDRTHGAEFESYDAAERSAQTPEPATTPTVPVAGSGSTSPEPEAERPWCGAPAELGGQQPCPIPDACPDGTCAIAGREPETCLGTDMDCGRPLPCPDHPRTPEERIVAVAEVAPEFVKPTLTLVPDADAERAAKRRDARALLVRVVELLSPTGGKPGYIETWARQLGPYDDELAQLVQRAHNALAALDDLISEAGK